MTDKDLLLSAEFTAHVDISLVEPSKRPCTFKLVHHPKASQPKHPPVLLDANEYIIGRSSQTDIALDSSELSRRHARFFRQNGTFSIEDLDSTNGVFLNGTKIHAAQLYHGDIIQLGDLVYEFCEWG